MSRICDRITLGVLICAGMMLFVAGGAVGYQGELTFGHCYELVVSPGYNCGVTREDGFNGGQFRGNIATADNRYVYTAVETAGDDEVIWWLKRDHSSLASAGCHMQNTSTYQVNYTTVKCDQAGSPAHLASGNRRLVATTDSLVVLGQDSSGDGGDTQLDVYRRNPSTGAITFGACYRSESQAKLDPGDQCNVVPALQGLSGGLGDVVADDDSVYVSLPDAIGSGDAGGILAFDNEHDSLVLRQCIGNAPPCPNAKVPTGAWAGPLALALRGRYLYATTYAGLITFSRERKGLGTTLTQLGPPNGCLESPSTGRNLCIAAKGVGIPQAVAGGPDLHSIFVLSHGPGQFGASVISLTSGLINSPTDGGDGTFRTPFQCYASMPDPMAGTRGCRQSTPFQDFSGNPDFYDRLMLSPDQSNVYVVLYGGIVIYRLLPTLGYRVELNQVQCLAGHFARDDVKGCTEPFPNEPGWDTSAEFDPNRGAISLDGETLYFTDNYHLYLFTRQAGDKVAQAAKIGSAQEEKCSGSNGTCRIDVPLVCKPDAAGTCSGTVTATGTAEPKSKKAADTARAGLSLPTLFSLKVAVHFRRGQRRQLRLGLGRRASNLLARHGHVQIRIAWVIHNRAGVGVLVRRFTL